MGRLGVALVLSLSAAGLVSDASAARSLGVSADLPVHVGSNADLSAGAAVGDSSAYFPDGLNAVGAHLRSHCAQSVWIPHGNESLWRIL